VIERKPPPAAKRSSASLQAGQGLYSTFRKFVPLEGPLKQSAVDAIAGETGLGERHIRELARRFRANPIAESLAPLPKGPKPGSRRASKAVQDAIDTLIERIMLKKPPPSVGEAASTIRSLLIADTGEFKFPSSEVPSDRTIERLIIQISAPHLARTTMGSKRRSAHEPHPGHYASAGLLDVVQMDHARANVMLVDSTNREPLDRPWVTLLIDVWSRCILGFYVVTAHGVGRKGLRRATGFDSPYRWHRPRFMS
jgi:putative transposase